MRTYYFTITAQENGTKTMMQKHEMSQNKEINSITVNEKEKSFDEEKTKNKKQKASDSI